MNLIMKYSKQLRYGMLIVGILFAVPFLHTLILSTFIVIFDSDKLSVYDYFVFLGESMAIQFVTIIPAIVLIIMGITIKQKFKNPKSLGYE